MLYEQHGVRSLNGHMAAYHLPPPEPMNCHGDVATNWKVFRDAYEDYAVAAELTGKDAPIQAATLKTVMGKECKQILNRLGLTGEELKSSSTILAKLEAHFAPTRNVLFERYRFHSAEQQPSETVDQFLIRLKHLAETCSFTALLDEMIRDRLVLGCNDHDARARLFREKDCTLAKAIETLRISETTRQQLKQLNDDADSHPVNTIKLKKSQSALPAKGQTRDKPCAYCGRTHERNNCPAFGKQCHHCGKLNHFKSVCRQQKIEKKAVSQIEEEQDDSDHSAFTVECIGTVAHNSTGQYFVPLSINDDAGGSTVIKCQIDTGATCNVMTFTDLCATQRTESPSMKSSTAKLKFYDNSTLGVLGEKTLHCKYQGSSYHLNFKIIKGIQKPLLSGTTCEKLGLITFTNVNSVRSQDDPIIVQFSDVFQGLGCLEGDYHIEVDPSIKPVQHVPRRVPLALKARLKAKLDDLEQRGVIKKVDKPTTWISSMVTVVKPDKLRICIDPKDLNKAIKRPKYQMPILDEVLPNLADAKIFSVLDAKDGFHQVKLDKSSSYLTTFWTPFGRYRYLRMPFGISSAPEEYQRRMHNILQGLHGVEVIADDILVYGCGATEAEYMQDHDNNLTKLLERARAVNLKLNRKKLKLRLSEVRYMGHLLTSHGLRADPSKVKAITEMPRPQDKKGVERLLGSVQYLARFLPRLSEVAKPLRQLTEKDVVFTWQQSQEEAFTSIQTLVSSNPVLRFYDIKDEVTVQCDASESGLGATLLQSGQPVAYASRALSPTEQSYAQIEKECMAIVFACEKFDQYLHGRHLINVETDHKPLIPIFKKPLLSAPKRLQRMLLRLQRYTLSVKYCPGKQIYIADMLSRAYLHEKGGEEEHFSISQLQLEVESICHAEHVRMKESTHRKVKNASQTDQTLQVLMSTVLQGWPEHRRDTPTAIHSYWNYRDEITAQDGVLYRGSRVIIPRTMRPDMLKKAHENHQGAEATIRRAKDVLFWPGMNGDIHNVVSQCSLCNEYLTKQQKEPMMTPEIPTRPWQVVAQDLFTLDRENFLITVDYFSDFWELDQLPDTLSSTVVTKTKQNFSRYGIPEKVISDNGPQFCSQEYTKFAQEWDFTHLSSSPYHSQGNGKAESAVKIAKSLLKKTKRDGTDIHMSILNWRNTPTEASEYSPSQKLHSRRTRTTLPTTNELLTPEVAKKVDKEIHLRRQQAKQWYDKSAKSLPELVIGQGVRMQPLEANGRWKPAKVVKKVGERSYLAQTENGKVYRRNRKHFRTTMEPPNMLTSLDDDALESTARPVLIPEVPAETDVDQSTSENELNSEIDRASEGCDSDKVLTTRSGRIIKQPARYRDDKN